MFRRLQCIKQADSEPQGPVDFGVDATRLLGAIEESLVQAATPATPLRHGDQLRQALGQAHTGQVVMAVHAQLRRMQGDWGRHGQVARLAIQARVLLQLLAELGEFPAGPSPDRLAAEDTEPNGG